MLPRLSRFDGLTVVGVPLIVRRSSRRVLPLLPQFMAVVLIGSDDGVFAFAEETPATIV